VAVRPALGLTPPSRPRDVAGSRQSAFDPEPSDEVPKSGLCGDGKRLVYAFPNKKKPPEGGV